MGTGVYGLPTEPSIHEERMFRSNSQASNLAPLKHSLSGLLQNTISVAADSRNLSGVDSHIIDGGRSEDQLLEGLSLMQAIESQL